jgi:uncharacterized repeat protein (TIGR03803 family)
LAGYNPAILVRRSLLVVALLLSAAAPAQTLHEFESFALTDGDSPSGGLLIDSGSLYGTTQYGGSKGGGTLFRVPIPKARRRVATP